MRPRDYYVTVKPAVRMVDREAPRRADAQAALTRGLDACGDPPATGEVLDGEPAAALASASTDLDLLVCGSRGLGPLRTLLLGGTSHALVRRAACPVLVVPPGTEATLSAGFRDARMVA
jgi:nucleotide-binding universal stress UspA family protein